MESRDADGAATAPGRAAQRTIELRPRHRLFLRSAAGARRSSLAVAAIALAFLVPHAALATNTAGVFGPVVNDGHAAAEYRGGFDPDTDAYAQRIHYERSLDDDLMWRVVVQAIKPDGGSTGFDWVQGELFWQLDDITENWQTAVRFDVLIRDGDRPGLFSFNWTNQVQLSERLSARFLTMVQHDIGNNGRDGLVLQTRARLRYALDRGYGAGLEMFNFYGSLADLSGFDNQGHQVGPFVDMQLGQGVKLFAGALFGISDVTPDTHLRLWINFGF